MNSLVKHKYILYLLQMEKDCIFYKKFLIVSQFSSCTSTAAVDSDIFARVHCAHLIPLFAMVSLVELPVVEKLQLSELMGSSMEGQDESVDEDELLKFKELKEKMILLDKAELGSIAQGDRSTKPCLLPITKR